MAPRLRKHKIAALALLIPVLVCAFAWLFARPLAVFAVSRAIGHEVSIAGSFTVHLFPAPGLTTTGVSVAAPKWSARRSMLTIERLSLSVDPAALLQGRLVFSEVRLASPVVAVERNAEGRLNWQTQGQGGQGPASGSLPTIRRLILQNGKVIYGEPGNRMLSVAVERAVWRWEHDGSGTLHANGAFDGERWVLELSANPVPRARAGQAYTIDLRFDSEPVHARADGTLGWPVTAAESDVALSVAGPDLARVLGVAAGSQPMPQRYAVNGRLLGKGDAWELSNLLLQIGGTELHGRLALDAGTARPVLSGDLVAAAIGDDVAMEVKRLWRGLRGRRTSPAQAGFGWLRRFDAHFSLAAGPATVGQVSFQGLDMKLSLVSGLLEIDPFVLRLGGGSAHATLRLDARTREVQGRLALALDDLPLAPLVASPRAVAGGRLNGGLALAFSATGLEHADGSLRLQAPGGTDVRIRLDQPRGPPAPMQLLADGRLQGAAVQLVFSGQCVARPEWPAPFDVAVRLGGTRAKAAGRFVGPGGEFRIMLSLSGPGTEVVSRLTGLSLPKLPPYSISGQVELEEGNGIRLQTADVRGGQSRFRATGAVDDVLAPRHIRLEIRADSFAYSDFAALRTSRKRSWHSWLQPLDKLDATLHLRAGRIVLPKATVLRDVRVLAGLHDGELDLSSLRLGIGGGTIAAHAQLDGFGDRPPGGTLSVSIDHVRLGQALRPLGLQERFPGVLDGDLSLALGAVPAAGTASTLRYRDLGAGSDIRASLRQSPRATRLEMSGRYRREAFWLRGSGGPTELLSGHAGFPFEVDFMALATRGRIEGTLRDPLRLDGLEATLALAGPNPRRIEPVLGFRLPELPHYSLSGHLSREQGVWMFGPFYGSVGDSDLAGSITVDFPGGRPDVTATLHSTMLHLRDIASVVGAAPGGGASGSQRKRAARALRTTVLPNENFEFDQLARMDARVTYVAHRVTAGRLPLDSLRMVFSLDHGQLALTPLQFGVAGGTVSADMRLMGAAHPVRGRLKLDIANVRLRRTLARLGAGSLGTGRIDGLGAFDTAGSSVAAMAGSLDGHMQLSMAGGTLDALLVELGGLDLGEALLIWLGDDRMVGINCASIQATARNGVVDFGGSVLDTTDTRFTMAGQVFMPSERLALSISAHPKDFSLFSARSRFIIDGSFGQPGFHPSWLELAARAALAGVLGLVAPPAALLAFADPGLGRSAPCESGQ